MWKCDSIKKYIGAAVSLVSKKINEFDKNELFQSPDILEHHFNIIHSHLFHCTSQHQHDQQK